MGYVHQKPVDVSPGTVYGRQSLVRRALSAVSVFVLQLLLQILQCGLSCEALSSVRTHQGSSFHIIRIGLLVNEILEIVRDLH